MKHPTNGKRPGGDRGASETRLAASSIFRKLQHIPPHHSYQESRIRAVRDGVEFVEYREPDPRRSRARLTPWQRSVKGEAGRLGFHASPLARLWDCDRWEVEPAPIVLSRKVVAL